MEYTTESDIEKMDIGQANRKRSIGRPTKYKPEYAQKLIEYFNIEDEKKKTITLTLKNGLTVEEEKIVAPKFPTLEEFGWLIGVSTDAMNEWVEKYPEFRGAMVYAKQRQKQILISNTMAGRYHAGFAQFVAKNFYPEMKDETVQKVEHSGAVVLPAKDINNMKDEPTTPEDKVEANTKAD